MELLIAIALMALVCVLAGALGKPWGPAILAFGFGAWGLLLLASGLRGLFPVFGFLYIGAAFGEGLAAYELALPAGQGEGEAGWWRAWAAIVGATGCVAGLGMLMYLAAAVVSAMII